MQQKHIIAVALFLGGQATESWLARELGVDEQTARRRVSEFLDAVLEEISVPVKALGRLRELEAEVEELKLINAGLEVQLKAILNTYQPVWHFAMGHTGYECGFCQTIFEKWKEIEEPDNHGEDCALAAAMRWAIGQGAASKIGYMGDYGGPGCDPVDIDYPECTCGTGTGTVAGKEHAKGCPMGQGEAAE